MHNLNVKCDASNFDSLVCRAKLVFAGPDYYALLGIKGVNNVNNCRPLNHPLASLEKEAW